ncbi:MAG: LegC family aminotransferase [Culturomica sp.]|jgi:aminotransferase in exopolysaccharide biosynthesis|nr:LegC family aminotransferase [Culturomica sp.]
MYNDIIAFIRSTFNEPKAFIPLHAPVFTGNEKAYLNECIDTTFVSSVGKFVDRFEEMVAGYTGARKAVVCVNGTNALHLALLLAGVAYNDEVITQPLTFIATANAISYCGAHPVFMDVDKDTMGLSPAKVREWLSTHAEIRNGGCFNKTTRRRIKACVPMHTFGHPVHLDELMLLCREYHIELVEDAAESLGSFYKGKHTGTFGCVGVLSFNGNKTITTGGGGMLLFNDEKLAAHAKHLTTQAKVPHRWEFVHDEIGYNYRMPNINAALGCAQMEKINEFVADKRDLAQRYIDFFKDKDMDFFVEPKECSSNYWLNVVILKNREERDHFLTETNDSGVMTRPIWQLMNRLPMFKACQRGDLSNAEWFEERVVNLPSSIRL